MKARLKNHSLTLLELIIAICLVGLTLVLLAGIATYSRFQLTNAERLTEVENELAFILEHANKYVSQAIGHEKTFGENTVISMRQVWGGLTYWGIFIDADQDGLRDPAFDHWIAYRYSAPGRTVDFCSQFNVQTWQCPLIPSGGWKSISKRTMGFWIVKPVFAGTQTLRSNFLNVTTRVCYDPSKPCATLENPSVQMNTSITMPYVLVN